MQAQKIPGCRIQLGDRPIQITLRRALGSLSLWQKMRLAYYMITSKEPIKYVYIHTIFLEFSVLQIEYPLGGSSKKGNHVYFLLQVFWVILLFDIKFVLMLPW